MTGYGKAEAVLENGRMTVEVRSLNGKNADIGIRSSLLPKNREMEVRGIVAEKLVRGTIDLFLNWEPNAAESERSINIPLAQEYCNQIELLCSKTGLDSSGALECVLRMPDVLGGEKKDVITEENWPVVQEAIVKALDALNDFRTREGAILRADVEAKVNSILDLSRQAEAFEKERTQAIREKILARFEELSLQPDKDRLEAEMIFYLEKLDINEERVRLRQHCAYFLDTLDKEEFPGRKLGFIAQEMGREINTTGSKASHTQIQQLVVRMKDELEKIKEQSLNIL